MRSDDLNIPLAIIDKLRTGVHVRPSQDSRKVKVWFEKSVEVYDKEVYREYPYELGADEIIKQVNDFGEKLDCKLEEMKREIEDAEEMYGSMVLMECLDNDGMFKEFELGEKYYAKENDKYTYEVIDKNDDVVLVLKDRFRECDR